MSALCQKPTYAVQQIAAHSITSSAVASSVGGTEIREEEAGDLSVLVEISTYGDAAIGACVKRQEIACPS